MVGLGDSLSMLLLLRHSGETPIRVFWPAAVAKAADSCDRKTTALVFQLWGCRQQPALLPYPYLPQGSMGGSGDRGGSLGQGGHVLLPAYMQDIPYLPIDFPFTSTSYIRGQVLFPIGCYPYIVLKNGPVLLR